MSRVKNGSKANDSLNGLVDNETINAGSGDDFVLAGAGNDIVHGGAGRDFLFGGAGDDVLNGGSGRDDLYADGGDDILNGGDGDDTLNLANVQSGDSIVLNGDSGDDVFFLSSGVGPLQVQVSGGDGDDSFRFNPFGFNFAPGSSYVLETGNGVDTIEISGSQASARSPLDEVSVSDFTTGVGGDIIKLDALLAWAQGYNGTVNPFFSANRYVTVTQSGTDALLLFDVDGAGTDYGFQTVLRFKNTTSTALIRENFEYQGVNYLTSGAPNANPITNNGTNSNQTINGNSGGDSLNGAGGNDLINGLGGNDFIQGGEGSDTLNGGSGSDFLTGQDGSDTLNGESGDDTLDGGAGDDTLNGGSGKDQLYDNDGSNTLNGGDGDDLLQVDSFTANSTQVLNGGAGDDQISILGTLNVSALINGGEGDDEIYVRSSFFTGTDSGNITIETGMGVDTVGVHALIPSINLTRATVTVTDFTAGEGGDAIDLQPLLGGVAGYDGEQNPFDSRNQYLRIIQVGNDVVLQADVDGAGTEFDLQTALTLQNVNIASLHSDNFKLNGFGINPFVSQNELNGSALSETITAGSSADAINGGSGDDILNGGGGDDLLNGEAGNDQLEGGAGDDVLNGGAGRDQIIESRGNNTLNGGDGDDLLLVQTFTPNTTQVVSGDGGDDTIVVDGGYGVNATINGGDGDDSISIADTFFGGDAGTVTINTGAGLDTLSVNGIRAFISEAPTIVVVNDFTSGVGGDVIDLLPLISYTQGYDGVSNPFASSNRFVRVVQSGADVNLQFDVDGSGTEYGFRTVLTLKNITTASLVRENFVYSGVNFLPTGAANAAPVNNAGTSANQTINGNTGDDLLNGQGGNDIIRGLAGRDQISGGEGDDSLEGGSGDDSIFGDDGNDILNGDSGNDFLQGGAGDDVLNGGSGRDSLYAEDSNDTLNGGDGDDILYGGLALNKVHSLNGDDGDDQIYVRAFDGTQISASGGNGDDLIYIESGSFGDPLAVGTLQITTGSGRDTVSIDANRILGSNLNPDLITVTDFQTGTGGDIIDFSRILPSLVSYDGSNPFTAGYLRLVQNGENVVLQVDVDARGVDSSFLTLLTLLNVDITTFLPENFNPSTSPFAEPATNNSEIIVGTEGADVLDGLAGDDTIYGLAGNDILMGGAGGDVLVGGLGDDTYIVEDLSDSIVELEGQGTDTVLASINYELGANLENLRLAGAGSINGTGNNLNNVLTGNSAVNMLGGGLGDDVLDGGAGVDTLAGGLGDDTFIVDNSSDSVVEDANEGLDSVLSSATFTLGVNVENLTLTGNAAINGTGNTLANIITGNDAANSLAGSSGNDTLIGGGGNDRLDGGTGNDTMRGGTGNDTYVVNSAADVLIENANEGDDTVSSTISYTLGANLERLTLTGSAAINGTGNALANIITGNNGANLLQGGEGNDTLSGLNGNDTLDGGVGNDKMTGGAGDDTYVVDSALDQVIEALNGGTDTVNSTLTYVLGDNVENLNLTGSGSINGTGNALNNTIVGNSGANILDGGSGNDALLGGGGNDTYIVDSTRDSVIESASSGTDTVMSSVSFTLGDHVERLTLTGTSSVNATGNNLSNVLTGNSGNNQLFGGAGNDRINGGQGADEMTGGTGNDTYWVDSLGDTVIELVGEGVDTVNTTVDHQLAEFIENLTALSSHNLVLTGNSANNRILGNAGNNQLIGGAGSDLLVGGAGADRFTFMDSSDSNGVDSLDVILDFRVGEDLIDLSGLSASGNLVFIGDDFFDDVDATGQVRFEDGTLYLSTNADSEAELTIDLVGVVQLGVEDLLL
ncbi:type 1 secretion C-terminal target domain protein [Microcystis aeruginosa FACHB-905 = DIANCHI905]|nr:type 1 secretion C-terminal target domain protein [Microcystis aeruginosa FACHB-905 = DIANCHI905]